MTQSHITVPKMRQMPCGCPFCLELDGQETEVSKSLRIKGLSNRVMIDRKGVVSLPGIGPLRTGYSLVLPKGHFRSIAELPGELFSEVMAQREEIREILTNEFGGAICFEHGPGEARSIKSGPSCIDHAHLHIIPSVAGFRDTVASEFPEKRIGSFAELNDPSVAETPYLCVEDADGSCFLYTLPPVMPSQYLRCVWAELCGLDDRWDWSTFPDYERVIATYDFICGRRSEMHKNKSDKKVLRDADKTSPNVNIVSCHAGH